MNGHILIVLSQVMLGSVAIFARWSTLPAEWVTFFRCVFGASSLAALILVRRRITLAAPQCAFLPLVLTGVCMGLNWMFFFKAVLTTEISKAILLYNTAPFFVVISSTLFLKEAPTVRQLLCLLMALGGAATITGSKFGDLHLMAGDVYAVLAALLYAQVTVIGRHLKHVSAPILTLSQTTVGALCVLPIALLTHGGSVQFPASAWVILITMGVFHTAVPYLLYFEGLKSVTATSAGILQYVYTLSTILFACIFFSEPVTLSLISGGAVILLASFVSLKHPGHAPITQLFQLVVRQVRKVQ